MYRDFKLRSALIQNKQLRLSHQGILNLGHQAILRGPGEHVVVGWMEVGEEKYSTWKEPFP